MIRVFVSNWWLLALRGVLALLFAILVFALRPLEESFFTQPIVQVGLVMVFALLALAAGMSTIAAALFRGGKDRSHLLLWDGIAVSVAGFLVLLAPRPELAWLVLMVAMWAIVVGILELLIARTLRRHIPDEWSLSLAGTGSLIFGVYFLFQRNESVSLLRWLGVYAAFSAVTILALAFRLRGFRSSIHKMAEGGREL